MLDVFKSLVSRVGPDYILEFKVSQCKQLYSVTCKYAKDGEYFVAISFYTDSWIAHVPAGPIITGRTAQCSTLNDIAVINKVATQSLCVAYPVVTDQDLASYLEAIKQTTLHQFDAIFLGNPYGDVVDSQLLLAPVPAILLTVKNGGELIGTMVVMTSGNIIPVFATNDRLNVYVDEMCKIIQQKSCGVGRLKLGGEASVRG